MLIRQFYGRHIATNIPRLTASDPLTGVLQKSGNLRHSRVSPSRARCYSVSAAAISRLTAWRQGWTKPAPIAKRRCYGHFQGR